MPSIKVADFNVNYQAPRGIPKSDREPIMLLVHGAGGSSRHWLPMLSQFNADIFPVAVDLPGHGETSGTVLHDFEAVAEFLDSFLTSLNIDRQIYYVGHSLGGLIGLQFALNYPQRVKQLVVMATSAKIRLHPDFLTSALSGEWDLATLRQSFAPKVPEPTKNIVLNEFKHTRLDSAADDFMGVSQVDLGDEVASLQIPTLIITGSDDVIISPRKAMLLLKQIPDARLINIPGAGHYLQVEEPGKVAKEIEEFLLSVPV
ncbi:MAG TPA: alpha/beta hydrolase [Coleofasciculaceae cyanobacterium]|jgi:pimeloyl-ACP methyl ester carboxylesterase